MLTDPVPEAETQVASVQSATTRSDWIRGPDEAVPEVPPELLQTAMLPELAPYPKMATKEQPKHYAHLVTKKDASAAGKLVRRDFGNAGSDERPRKAKVKPRPVIAHLTLKRTVKVQVRTKSVQRITKVQRKREHRDSEISDLRRELNRRMGKALASRLGYAFGGGRMKVFSVQTKGTRITRRQDRQGNRVFLIQSD